MSPVEVWITDMVDFVFQAGGNVSRGWSPLHRCQSQPAALGGLCSALLVKPKRQSACKCWLLLLRALLAKGCPATSVSGGVMALPDPSVVLSMLLQQLVNPSP